MIFTDEKEEEESMIPVKHSEFHLNQCSYHHTMCIHEIRLAKKREEASFVDFDDFVKLYSGDYLFVENVIEFLDLLEVILCIYNSKSRKFHMIRTRLNRQAYWEVISMKSQFVHLNHKKRSLKLIRQACHCYYD